MVVQAKKAENVSVSEGNAFTPPLGRGQAMPHSLQFTSKEVSFACLQPQPQMTEPKPSGAMRETIHAMPGARCGAKRSGWGIKMLERSRKLWPGMF